MNAGAVGVADASAPTAHSFTGRLRRRRTKRSVRLVDGLARALIGAGGIGTIVAVSMVCVFLVWVAAPLFLPASVRDEGCVAAAGGGAAGAPPIALAVDEHQTVGWSLWADGTLRVFRMDSGASLDERRLFADAAPTAASVDQASGAAVFGFADGTMRLATLTFQSRLIEPGDVPAQLRDLPAGQIGRFENGIVRRTPQGPFWLVQVGVTIDEPVRLTAVASPIVLIDRSVGADGPVVCALTADGVLRVSSISRRTNLMTGEVTTTLYGGEAAAPSRPGAGPPARLLLSGLGDAAYLIWDDGYSVRLDTGDLHALRAAQTLDLAEEDGARVTAARFLIGKTTLVTGDSRGRVRTWFRIKPAGATTPDGSVLVKVQDLAGPWATGSDGPPVASLAVSARTRLVAAGYADGSVRLFQATSAALLAEARVPDGAPVGALAMAPKDDGFVAGTATGVCRWGLDPRYPEATLSSLFLPVWYEGYEGPRHVWQSTGGTDDFEPKLGMMPLVFGTIKATTYTMLFGVPIALLAAIYASEFLAPRTRARIKPTIEMMAGLPSVVLGFLAGLVFAPFVEGALTRVLACLLTVPVAFVVGAYLWQLLPRRAAIRLSRWRFGFILAVLPVGVGLGALLGPVAERVLFAGDFRAWLDGRVGGAWGGWAVLLLPLSALAVALVLMRIVHPWLRHAWADRSTSQAAWVDLGKFILGAAATAGLAAGVGMALGALGLDPRGSLVGTYVQRNALIVGFAMGFAIIPIIYTISEDALAAVPDHLRAASLGAGATQWQTAMRIVIPTAMSGLFSAVMIGFGRAVGETMIVLMAAGNTPVMDLNIFNGFRTLSANIAVELPEAVQGSAHFRTLFLAALTLFAMTFAINTVAEVVRQRFRRRAYQL